MENNEFNRIVEKRCAAIKSVLASKAKEYARGDRLHNFKRAAAALRCTPEQALIGMYMKHQVSILDLVDDISNGYPPKMLTAVTNEKVGDAINYLILLEALIAERVEKEAKEAA